ncbi:MAG: glycosyltransferase [Microbacterium sp.]
MTQQVIEVSDEIAHAAAFGLWERDPQRSARRVLSRAQGWTLAIALVVFLGCLALWWRSTVVVTILVLSVVFLLATAFKFWVSMRGARYDLIDRIAPSEIAALADDDLPIYTILVPVFREANIVHQLVENLDGLDYPKDRLEILILVEEEDDETRGAIQAAGMLESFHVVIVPKGQPQTKPRACNAGLAIAKGEYLVIYDAEDAPEPLQLKKALLAFRRAGDDTLVIQAPLNYFNVGENVLTRMFTLEYSYWFDYMLTGLEQAALPIPLGGTSNHFRTDALRRLGGWDPFNVTEDADLGVRASVLGGRVGVIDSVTMEEANTSIPNFIRQRSRWIKGYMQTTLVHARSPLRLIREIGLRRFLGFALLIAGTPLTFLGVLPFILVIIITWIVPSNIIASYFPLPVLLVSLANFLIGNVLIVHLNMMGPFKRGRFRLVPWAMLNPLYWILHSIAAYKGLWQLITKPHYWEKTEHGLTQQTHSE